MAEPDVQEIQEPELGYTEALGEHGSMPEAPRSSGDIIHALGGQHRVSSCENRIKAQMEQFVRAETAAEIQRTEATDPDEAEKERAVYLTRRAAGDYNWGGSAVVSVMRTVKGIKHLLYLLLLRCNPKMTTELAERILKDNPKDCGMAIAWALGNSNAPQGSGATASNGSAATGKTKRTATATPRPPRKTLTPATLDDPG
jgi:hypothetical protein